MTYTTTHPPIDMHSNKGDGPSIFYEASLHDNAHNHLFDDVFDFDAAACALFDTGALTSTGGIADFDSQSSSSTSPSFQFVDIFPDLGASASPPTATGFHYPSFLSGITNVKTENGVSRPQSAISGQASDKTDSPSPPPLTSSVRPSPARKVCVTDTELLKLENISLYTPKRPRVQATPTSPCPKRPNTLSRVVSFNSRDSSSCVGQQHIGAVPSRSATFSSDIPLRSRAIPRTASAAPRTPSPRPRAVPHRKATPFTHSFVEDPFYKPSTAPMPPPRKPKSPRKQHGAISKKKVPSQSFEQHLDSSSTVVSREQSPAQQAVPIIKTDENGVWGSPESTCHFSSSNDGLGAWWSLPGVFDGNIQLGGTEAAAQNATLATYTNMGEFGYGGYSGSQLSQDPLWGGLAVHLPQPPHQPAPMVQNLTLSVATLQHASSPPAAPYRPQQQSSLSAPRHHPASTSTSLKKVRSLGSDAGSSSSSPPRGRHVLGEPSMARSASAISRERTVRKRKSSTRKELKPFGSTAGASGAGGAAGFVNFTPDDSQILLTGVAPSGSSKTKAKRDREEQERRRRLGEAALKAVEAAGGDVGLLAEETKGFLGRREGLEFE